MRGIARVLVVFFVLGTALIGSTARADDLPDESDYRSFWHDAYRNCVDSDDVLQLFDPYNTGQPWRFWTQRNDREGHGRDAIPRVDALLDGRDGVWNSYKTMLGGYEPGNRTHPVNIIIVDEAFYVGYGDETAGGIASYSCDDGPDAQQYIFIPYGTDSRNTVNIAHEIFHSFHARSSPWAHIKRGGNWFY